MCPLKRLLGIRYSEKSKQISKSVRADQQHWLTEVAVEAQNAADSRITKKTYRILKRHKLTQESIWDDHTPASRFANTEEYQIEVWTSYFTQLSK